MTLFLKLKEKLIKLKQGETGINWFNFVFIILSLSVAPLAIDFYIKHFMKESVFHSERMHYLMEILSAFICALSVYYLSIRFINSGKVRFLFVAMGFSMLGLFSLVDGFTAEETRRILWFRAISGFSTAALFLAAAILDEKKLRFGPATLKRMNYFAISSAVIILSIAEIFSLYFSTYIPRDILSGLFVEVGAIIIVVCGFAYLTSGLLFLWHYKRKADKEYSIFLIVSIILCEKNLIFYRLAAGGLSWWLWHFLQLGAYALIAIYLMERYSKSIWGFVYEIEQRQNAEKELLAIQQQLRAANQQLRASEQQLRAANQQLRASQQQLQAANQQLKANNLQLQREIAQRKQAEEALKESQKRFRIIFEEVTDGILLADPETKKFYFGNKAIYQMLGYNEEEIGNVGVMDIHPPKDLPYVLEQFEKQNRREIILAKDIPVKRKDGGVFYADVNSAPITLTGKTYLMGIFRDITERKKTEEAIRMSEERYRLLAENVRDAIWTMDLNLRFTYITPSIKGLLGYTVEECMNLTLDKILPPDHLEAVMKVFAERMTEAEFEQNSASRAEVLELEHIRKDGSKIWAEIKVSFLCDAEGRRVGILGVSRDITERKKSESELFRVNLALKTISECNQSLVRAADEPSLLNEICRNLIEVGGYRLAWVGLAEDDATKIVRPAAQAGYEEGYLDNLKVTWADTERGQGPTGTAIRTGKVYICKNILTDPKFEPWRAEAIKRGYASSIAIPLIVGNRTLGALNIYAGEPDVFDEREVILLWELTNDLAYGIVTLRTHAEREQAVESLKKYFSAVEQTADIVIITDKEGLIEYVNSAFERVTGYTKAEVVGKTPRILKSGKHDQQFYEKLWKKILSGDVFSDVLINKRKDGRFYYAEKTITPIRDKEARIVNFVSTDKDVTERKEIENAQRLAQLGELVADMAHEVNNPLMIISGTAQLALMEEIQNEELKNNLKVIFGECHRAKDIIQRLLKFSRPSKGELKETDINKCIEAVAGIVEHQFKLANIEIRTNYAENSPLILLDGQQMQEVFMNLLNNSRDAMLKGGVIEITTGIREERMRIDFKDTGCGMTEEAKKRLFEPFFTTKERGTGLGLAVCYGIIKAHNGELKFESEPEKGTIATIFLPLKGGE
jgi:PAS domain S-box-containing protein